MFRVINKLNWLTIFACLNVNDFINLSSKNDASKYDQTGFYRKVGVEHICIIKTKGYENKQTFKVVCDLI